ncbi:MAG: hypothetical protein ACYC5H_16810 [Methylovirgula sp.]
MISRARVFGFIAGLAGPLTLTLVSSAIAQERTPSGSQVQIGSQPWLALDRCAAYGPEFTSVEGTDACVKIGGHVRVEFGPQNLGRTIKQGWGRTAPAAMRSEGFVGGDPAGPRAQHLRLRDDDAPAFPGSYLR